MDWLKNITLNLTATGPAAVLCVYIVSLAAMGIFASGPHGGFVVGALVALGPVLIGALSQRIDS